MGDFQSNWEDWEQEVKKAEEARIAARNARLPAEPRGATVDYGEAVEPILNISPEQVQEFLRQSRAGTLSVPAPEEKKIPAPPISKPTQKPARRTAATKPKVDSNVVIPPAATLPPSAPIEPLAPFPEMQYTPRVDVERELSGILEAMPKTLEDLAGPRPRAIIREPKSLIDRFLQILLLSPAANEAGGWGPYYEKEQAAIERTWKDELAYQQKRQEMTREYRLKGLDARQKQVEEQRELERKQYAALGERNPSLAQNPGYVEGLYPDIPKAYRDKLRAQSIDPETGMFKKGALLYISPEERWKFKKDQLAAQLKDLGITDPKDQATYIDNADKYYELIKDRYSSIEKNILWLSSQPKTPENIAKINELIDYKRRMDENAKDTPDHIKLGHMLKVYDQQEAIAKERAKAEYELNIRVRGEAEAKKILQSESDYIRKLYNDYRDLANRRYGSGMLSAYKSGGAEKPTLEDQLSETAPDMRLYMRIFPTLFPVTANKADIVKRYEEIDMISARAARELTGKIPITEWTNKQVRNNVDKYYIEKLWGGLLNMFDAATLQAAANKYGDVERIPYFRLHRAATLLSIDPTRIGEARQILLGATQ
jgi:hypothetical protein